MPGISISQRAGSRSQQPKLGFAGELGFVPDRLFSTQSTTLGKVARYTADTRAERSRSMVSSSDYYPFGMQMPGRKVDSGKYRYGFNGKEKETGITGSESHYDFEARIYDGRIGRFLSADPLRRLFPFITSYSSSGNNPIKLIDSEGKNPIDPQQSMRTYNMLIMTKIVTALDVKMQAAYNMSISGDQSKDKDAGGISENGFYIIQKADKSIVDSKINKDGSTLKNNEDGTLDFTQPKLNDGETYLGDFHTHPKDTRERAHELTGQGPSSEDLFNMPRKSGYISIIETDIYRYAITIDNVDAYAKFATNENKIKLENAISERVKADFKEAEEAGTLDKLDLSKSVYEATIEFLNSSSENTGISVYKSTDGNKTNMKRTTKATTN